VRGTVAVGMNENNVIAGSHINLKMLRKLEFFHQAVTKFSGENTVSHICQQFKLCLTTVKSQQFFTAPIQNQI
jgi:hypothetical protein